jgi:two-component system phosphate regulon sensor histidine kinase PhoR
MRWPISLKLSLSYLGVICIAGLPALLLLDIDLGRSLRERRDRELVSRARLIADLIPTASPAVGTPDSGAAALAAAIRVQDALADRLARDAGARITLIDPDGRVLGDSALDPTAITRLDSHRDRPEVAAALAGGEGVGVGARVSRTLGESMHYAAVAYPTQQGRAVVRLGVPEEEIEAFIRSGRRRVLLAAAAALGLGLLLSLVVGRAVSAPLRVMTGVAKQLAAGHATERLRMKSGDEFGDLAQALNQLSGDLVRTVGQLDSEQEQLRGVLEGMAEGVLLIDGRGKILLANRAAAQALLHGGQASGRTPLEVTRSADLDELVRGALATGSQARGSVTLTGSSRVFDASVIPLTGPERRVVVVMHDISEVKRLETVRREFVANISHELRTPLTAIRGFIDTLDGEPELTEADRQRFLAAASRHVHRLSNLVNDLLALAKLDSPEFKLELVACDIQSEVERALELHVAAAHERGVALSSAVEAGLPSVLADPVALEQILSNLIDNAIKYNRPEGRVVVRGVRVGDLLRIAVEDTGVGIPAVHLPRIFERLYRVDPGRSRAEGGTGLGLAIVKHLVLKHGGDVWVTSEPGRGSSFWFTLRLEPTGSA